MQIIVPHSGQLAVRILRARSAPSNMRRQSRIVVGSIDSGRQSADMDMKNSHWLITPHVTGVSVQELLEPRPSTGRDPQPLPVDQYPWAVVSSSSRYPLAVR